MPTTPPSFIAEYEGSAGWGSTTDPKNTGATVNGNTGDVFALTAAVGNDTTAFTINLGYSSSPVETWTERAETTGTSNNDAWSQSATTVLTANRSGMTVTADPSVIDPTNFWNFDLVQFRGSDGVGNTAASGRLADPPSWSFTTTFDNSAVVAMFVDWNAADGTTRTWRTVNGITPTVGNGQELVYFRDSAQYTVFVAYWSDVGAAGAKTLGLTLPTGTRIVASGVEVRGTASTTQILLMPARSA